MSLWRNLFEALLALLLAFGCVPPEHAIPSPGDGDQDPEPTAAKLILHQQAPPTLSTLVANQAQIDALPFDGTTFSIPASYDLQGTQPYSVETLRSQLAAYADVHMNQVTDHWVIIYAAPAGPISDYQTVIDNFANLAQVAGEVGLAGIFFDTEEYLGDTWGLEVLGEGRPEADVLADTRARGREMALAMAQRWPDTRIVVTLGPWIAETKSANAEFLGEACVDDNGLIYDIAWANQGMGAFTVGLALGNLESGITFIDGAEMYTQRTLEDWERSHYWVTEGMATHSDLVPEAYKEDYANKVEAAQGTYDFPIDYRCKGPTGPTEWENDIKHALMTSDSFAWAYSERFDWVGNPYSEKDAPPEAWMQATRQGKAAGQAH